MPIWRTFQNHKFRNDDNDTPISDPKETADAFNDLFINIFQTFQTNDITTYPLKKTIIKNVNDSFIEDEVC